jgi:hypothetical protein
VFEGLDEAGYHFLDQQSREAGTAREVVTFLLGLTRWTFDEIY